MPRISADGNYSTLVAQSGVKATKSLAAKARASKQRVAAKQDNLVTRYGTAMSGEINRVFKPAEARAAAGLKDAAANVGAAKTAVQTSMASSKLYHGEVNSMGTAQGAALARVQAEGKPSMISAQSAIASANAYAKNIGIDMKKMDWSAKSAIYEAVISQNFEMAKMAYASQLQIDAQEKMYELQKSIAADEQAAQAPAVVDAISTQMPALVNDLASALDFGKAYKLADGTEVTIGSDTATQVAMDWANKHTMDAAAAPLIADIAFKAIIGIDQHVQDGVLDGSWLNNLVSQSVSNAYPTYSGYSTQINNALSPSVYNAVLAASPSGGGPMGTSPGLIGSAVQGLNSPWTRGADKEKSGTESVAYWLGQFVGAVEGG